jgi:hypothetical protein
MTGLTNVMRLGSLVGWAALTAVAATGAARSPLPAGLTANEIVRRSVVNNDRNWLEAPQYTYREKDIVVQGGKRTVRSYEVMMIDGWPYRKLIAADGHPLPPAQAQAEERKLEQEIARRKGESAAERALHTQEYLRERRQDHELMHQMMKAFDFKLLGQETVDGHRCYVFESIPRPDYRPINRDTQVLKGMRGTLWVDAERFQWVKVHAEVYRPVAFGLFIAHVEPGTEFTLEQEPVGGGIWLPVGFDQEVKANILFFWPHNSSDHESYWDYRRQPQQSAPLSAGG